MKIVKTRKEFICSKCGEKIFTNSITLQIIENNMPRAFRKYYHRNCGLSVLAGMSEELEKSK